MKTPLPITFSNGIDRGVFANSFIFNVPGI